MTNIYKRTCAIGIVLAAAIVLQSAIALAATDRTVSVAATAAKPMTPGAVLDDFRYAAPLNLWSVSTGTFSGSTAVPTPADQICTASYISDANALSGYSLKLEYNVTATNGYAGYYSMLRSNMTAGNLSGYNAVSFWVKGAIGGEFFKIQLKNQSTTQYSYTTWDDKTTKYYRSEAAVYITDFLDNGVTTDWQKVTIPFNNFANLDGWTSMGEFVIVFESSQSGDNGSVKNGTIYIDNISFETGGNTRVRIDHFGDKLSINSLGGVTECAKYGGTISRSFSDAADEYYPVKNGLRLNYDLTNSGSWAAVYLIFGGGNDNKLVNPMELPDEAGWIAVPQNFQSYNYLTLKVRAVTGGNPIQMKIELEDNTNPRPSIAIVSPISTIWPPDNDPESGYRIKIPLAEFIDINTGYPFPIDKTSIKKITFTLEHWRIHDWGAIGDTVGTVFIDSVQFEQ